MLVYILCFFFFLVFSLLYLTLSLYVHEPLALGLFLIPSTAIKMLRLSTSRPSCDREAQPLPSPSAFYFPGISQLTQKVDCEGRRMAFALDATAKEQVLQGLISADILPLIFSNVGLLKQGDLHNAALVCKAFSAPALDVLWRRIFGVDPFWPFMESILNKTSSTTELRRFELYRKRVHTLYLVLTPQPTAHREPLDAVLEVCQSLDKEKLFPKLRDLAINIGIRANSASFVPFLLTSSLRTFHFSGVVPHPDQLFSLISSLAPEMQDLNLNLETPTVDATQSFRTIPLERLSGIKQVQDLTIRIDYNEQGHWSLKMSSVHHLLQQLPCLRHLCLSANEIEHDCPPSMDMASLVAPLKQFSLLYQPNSQKAIQPIYYLPFVTEIELSIEPLVTVEELALFVSAVASHLKLSEFTLVMGAWNDTLTGVVIEDLLPLFSSRTLQQLVIDSNLDVTHRAHMEGTPCHYDQPDAERPPRLPRKGPLCFPTNIFPTPTFDVLMKFAKHTPWLTELTLSVSRPPDGDKTSLASLLQGSSEMRFENSQLRVLYLIKYDNPFDEGDHPLLAKCLDTWFPNLEELIDCDDIDKLRKEFRRMRLSERESISGRNKRGPRTL
ncbi:hypothetical protein BKA70DRAFT_1229376 [Coprinopsis sp. MPI-PUGE-AT-0042]|nr:hypothetical protein BKA70DRAFT_1229376 [Coprinopsis sp. MPI-PUGE-AT-0042]